MCEFRFIHKAKIPNLHFSECDDPYDREFLTQSVVSVIAVCERIILKSNRFIWMKRKLCIRNNIINWM